MVSATVMSGITGARPYSDARFSATALHPASASSSRSSRARASWPWKRRAST